MTDNDIIKALQCCNDGACEYCPICDNDCIQKCRSEAIDLINRQKAEVEELKADKIIAERHEKDARDLFKQTVIKLKTAKFEAYKEFAHLLIDKSENGVIHTCDIPDLVKEMAGENNA